MPRALFATCFVFSEDKPSFDIQLSLAWQASSTCHIRKSGATSKLCPVANESLIYVLGCFGIIMGLQRSKRQWQRKMRSNHVKPSESLALAKQVSPKIGT